MSLQTGGSSKLTLVNLFVGIWLIISPFVLIYTNIAPAVWNNVGIGILLILLVTYVLFSTITFEWAGWIMAALGVWEIISPFVLGFWSYPTIMWNNIIAGIIIWVVGAWFARASWQQARPSR